MNNRQFHIEQPITLPESGTASFKADGVLYLCPADFDAFDAIPFRSDVLLSNPLAFEYVGEGGEGGNGGGDDNDDGTDDDTGSGFLHNPRLFASLITVGIVTVLALVTGSFR